MAVAVRSHSCLCITQLAPAQDNTRPYNDEHFHIQDFKAEGPHLAEVMKMIDGRICRSTIMSLAFTVAHDPQIDGDFAPIYYTQSDGPVMYYNAIQDVLIAHKFFALFEPDRARLDPMMNAFNLKDARARRVHQADGSSLSECVERLR